MSANQYLLEQQVRHQILLLRRGAGLANEIIPEVERLIEQVIARVANTPDQAARQRAMLSELRGILAASYAAIGEQAMAGALELAEYEAGFQVKLLDSVATASFAAPALEQIVSAVTNDLMDLGPGQQMTIREALEQYGDKKARQVVQAISDGILQQQTNAEIAQTLRPMIDLQKRQVDALVRTVATNAANLSKRAVYTENKDLLKGERYVSTLDSRTTQTCFGLSDKVFPVGVGPMPAMHWRCRSVRVPIVRDDLQIPGLEGERPEVGADGPGVTSARTTMNSWLRRQPDSFQREFFEKYPQGEQKYMLFKRGNLNAQDFVDEAGSALSMEELRAKEPLAFARAGM